MRGRPIGTGPGKGLSQDTVIGGFVRTDPENGDPRVETTRVDELTRIKVDEAADRLAEGTVGKKRGWPKGKRRVRRGKLAVLGIPSGILDSGHPSYARCIRLAAAYRKTRARELAILHGYVSTGASSLLATASMALAASRFIYEQAAGSGERMLEMLKVAAKMADSARQNELAAWELCARESLAQKKAVHREQGIPWVVEPEKAKPGVKKRDPELLELPPVGTPLEGWVQQAKIEP